MDDKIMDIRKNMVGKIYDEQISEAYNASVIPQTNLLSLIANFYYTYFDVNKKSTDEFRKWILKSLKSIGKRTHNNKKVDIVNSRKFIFGKIKFDDPKPRIVSTGFLSLGISGQPFNLLILDLIRMVLKYEPVAKDILEYVPESIKYYRPSEPALDISFDYLENAIEQMVQDEIFKRQIVDSIINMFNHDYLPQARGIVKDELKEGYYSLQIDSYFNQDEEFKLEDDLEARIYLAKCFARNLVYFDDKKEAQSYISEQTNELKARNYMKIFNLKARRSI